VVDFRYHLVTSSRSSWRSPLGIVVGHDRAQRPVLRGLRGRNAGLISEKRAPSSPRSRAGDRRRDRRRLRPAAVPPTWSADGSTARASCWCSPGRLDRQTVTSWRPPCHARPAPWHGRLVVQPTAAGPGSAQLVDDLVAQVVPGRRRAARGAAGRPGRRRAGASLLVRPSRTRSTATPPSRSCRPSRRPAWSSSPTRATGIVPATTAVLLTGPAPAPDDEQDDEARQSEIEGRAGPRPRARRPQRRAPSSPARRVDPRGRGRAGAARRQRARRRGVAVDNVDRTVGQVAVVRALVEQLEGGAGRYGGAAGASSPVPAADPGCRRRAAPSGRRACWAGAALAVRREGVLTARPPGARGAGRGSNHRGPVGEPAVRSRTRAAAGRAPGAAAGDAAGLESAPLPWGLRRPQQAPARSSARQGPARHAAALREGR
jgi:hypothetical protein